MFQLCISGSCERFRGCSCNFYYFYCDRGLVCVNSDCCHTVITLAPCLRSLRPSLTESKVRLFTWKAKGPLIGVNVSSTSILSLQVLRSIPPGLGYWPVCTMASSSYGTIVCAPYSTAMMNTMVRKRTKKKNCGGLKYNGSGGGEVFDVGFHFEVLFVASSSTVTSRCSCQEGTITR